MAQKHQQSGPVLRGPVLQILTGILVIGALLLWLLIARGEIDPIPLTSWSALQTYLVDRAVTRWETVRRFLTPNPLIFPDRLPNPDPDRNPDKDIQFPTLADLWDGQAAFVVDVADSGLPMGESDTILLRNGQLWSYIHASDRSAGVRDRCGDPVAFPGCVVYHQSVDSGEHFTLAEPICLIACNQCPCSSQYDHIDQQQYPRVAFGGAQLHMVYEYRGMVMHRTSEDGLAWQSPSFVPATGVWGNELQPCPVGGVINEHPHAMKLADCLVGGPPGIYIEGDELFIFVAMGQSPSAMGCYRGRVDEPIGQLQHCATNPIFQGAAIYGPPATDATANAHFDFRTISSAEVQKVGSRYYMLYEGVRGAGPDDPGDTQFGLGLARSMGEQIDGPWDTFADNPILVDLPSNIGIGHADLVVMEGVTYLYTSLDGVKRSRLALQWR